MSQVQYAEENSVTDTIKELLVDTYDIRETLEALDDVLAEIKRQNFEIVTVSDNIKQ